MANSRFSLIFAGFAMVLFGVGCDGNEPLPLGLSQSAAQDESPAMQARTWIPLADGMAVATFADSDNMRFLTIFRISPETFTFSLRYDAASPRTVAAWADVEPKAMLAANLGYFLEDYSPAGLLVLDGEPLADRSFDAEKSGIAVLAPEFSVLDTANEPRQETATHAVQSYPLLVRSGIAAVTDDSGKSSRRTFIGEDRDGNMYVGSVTTGLMTLAQLSTALVENTDIQWNHVLNLDGGPSTGIIARTAHGLAQGSADSITPVPGVFIATPK